MNKCVYTTIEYFPKSFNNESINVGFIFHDVTSGVIKFKKISNKKRLQSFDDEIDLDDFNFLMDNFENFITKPFNIKSNNNDKRVNDEKYLESIQNMFLNEFRFNKINYIMSDDVDKDYNDLIKLSLYYDLEKKNRPKKDEIERIVKKNIKQALLNSNREFKESYTLENVSVGEPIKVDFSFENKCIKILDVKSEAFTSKINTAKVWCYNANELRDANIKLIIIIPNEIVTEQEKAYLRILQKANPKIYLMNDLSNIGTALLS